MTNGDYMLYDLKKSIKRMNDNYRSDEYKDLVYDLESFIIDLAYNSADDNESAERQSYLGKIELSNKVFEEKQEENVLSKIRPILSELGIPESVKGFRLLEYCVLEAARRVCDNGVYTMKDIYPVVGKKFGITAHNCERLCRYACESITPTVSFARRYPFFEELTHRTYEAVTVKELIDILVRFILAKLNFKLKTNIT